MPDVNVKYARHLEICNELNELYVKKNTAYGDSFGKTVQKKGLAPAITRMEDKLNRIDALSSGAINAVTDENIVDTLKDLANYAIMSIIELEIKQGGDGNGPATPEGGDK